MPISVMCPSGHKINASEKYAGKVVKCPKCKQDFLIPAVAELEPPEPVVEVVDDPDPFSNLPSAFDGTSDVHDPFGGMAELGAASYAQTAYPAAGGVPNVMQSQGAPRASGSKQQTAKGTSSNRKLFVLIGLIGGGASFLVIGLVVIVIVFFSSGSGGNSTGTSGTGGSPSGGSTDFELARTELLANFGPNGVPDNMKSQIDMELGALKEMSSPSAPVYFGYDAEKRSQLRKYLVAKGTKEGRAALIALQLIASLRKVVQEFDLKPDQSGNYPMPPDLAEKRKGLLDLDIKNMIGNRFPQELMPLVESQKSKTLSPEEEELFILVAFGFANLNI